MINNCDLLKLINIFEASKLVGGINTVLTYYLFDSILKFPLAADGAV